MTPGENHTPVPPRPQALAPSRRKSYWWLVFFVFIAVASVSVAIFMIRFNLSLQLKPEQLEAAWTLWKEKGPRDYLMVYTKSLNEDPRSTQFIVRVRGGRVEEVRMDGKPLEPDRLPYHSMDRLFADIERFMDLDRKAERRTYTVASFDPETGALRRYVRRVMGTRERVEILVEPLRDLPTEK